MKVIPSYTITTITHTLKERLFSIVLNMSDMYGSGYIVPYFDDNVTVV